MYINILHILYGQDECLLLLFISCVIIYTGKTQKGKRG